MGLVTCPTIARESLDMLADNLKFSAALPQFMRPTMRSALIEALGAWRAEKILGPAKESKLTIRKPPRYSVNVVSTFEDWWVMRAQLGTEDKSLARDAWFAGQAVVNRVWLAADEARFKHSCDADCRSPRCPAALERIAAGWRNGRDKE